MKTGISPWVYQLDQNRPIKRLSGDVDTDVLIVGAGIAGVSTAFFILRNTDRKVTIVEKNRLATGASGHNAGQVVAHFERSFYDLTQEFGLEKTADAQHAIENAWELITQMYTEAELDIPFSRFVGYSGFSSKEQVLHFLRDSHYRDMAGLSTSVMWIAHHADFLSEIPKEYRKFYKVVPQRFILERLETKNHSYVAAIGSNRGCVNSALFCQEVMTYMLRKYPDRLSLYEQTSVEKVILHNDDVLVDANIFTIKAKKIILCTNGFEKFDIINQNGLELNRRFHKNVIGLVGYMSGYLEKYDKPPTALQYFTDPDSSDKDPYFYLTRREFEYEGTEGKKKHNLVCIGGPEFYLPELHNYIEDFEFPDEAQKKIDGFVHDTYDVSPNHNIDYKFTWHGLMGYTPNRVRLVGYDPRSNVLMYNLGCNGVGILPSIFGGWRIAEMLSGRKVTPMIFDPRE